VKSINLLPARYQPARASGDRPGIGYAAIGALAVLLLMVLGYVLTQNGINDANEKKAAAQAEQQVAQAKIGQLQAFGDFATLKASREQAVRSVAQARFDYERLMREIALVLPHNTYLTQFSSGAPGQAQTEPTSGTTSTGPNISITGCAPSHPGVATAIVRLRKLHNIENVDLKSSQKAQATTSGTTTSACPVQWTASLAFNAEAAPTAPEPVPARLGGGQ
jgi:Tfp pilus assembly protein PilN